MELKLVYQTFNFLKEHIDSHASVFAAREFDKNDNGNYFIRRSTFYGFCTITLLSDNQIYLKLECSDWSYEGTFSKQ